MKKILFLLSLTACYAQTVVNINQIKAAPAEGVRVLSVTAEGRLTALSLGPGLAISNGQIVVIATAIPSVVVVQLRLTAASDGSYVTTPGAALYSRNGLVQEAGRDFTLEGGRLVPATPWASDDVVIQHAVKVNGTPAGLP